MQLIFDCASCGAWAPEAWKPRFQIFANLWKFNNRWNLKTWFLKIVYQRVSLSKIWAIHQNGRWRTILDPDRQPFLRSNYGLCCIFLNWLMKWYISLAYLHPQWHYTTLHNAAMKVTSWGLWAKNKIPEGSTLYFVTQTSLWLVMQNFWFYFTWCDP